MADWDVVSQTPVASPAATPDAGSSVGGVGSQTTDYAKQTADINKRIDGLIKDGALPTGPDKDTYDALVRQRSSIAAKAKDLGDRTEKAGAKALDFDGAVDKATAAAPKTPDPWAVVAEEPAASDAPAEIPSSGPSQEEIDNNVPGSPPVPGPGPGRAIIGAAKAAGSDIADLGKGLLDTAKIPGDVAAGKYGTGYGPEAQAAARQLAATIGGGEVSPTTAVKAAAEGAKGIGQAAGKAGEVAAAGAKKAISPVTSLANKTADTVKAATTKAPEQLAAEADTSAEALRAKTQGATQIAAQQTEDATRTKAAQAEAEKNVTQGKLDQATKVLDADVNADLRKVQAMRAARTPDAAMPKAEPYKLPQFVEGKPIADEVPARSSTPRAARAQGLSGELDQAIQQARQKVTDHASRLYTMGTKTAGETPVPNAGLRESAQDFIDSLPPDMQASVPRLITEIAHGENDTMTVAELQKLRTTLRDLGDNPKLTPSLKSAPYAQLAKKADNILHSPANPPAVKQGVRIIDAADKFYRTNMAQFRSQTLQKIADDVRDKLPMNASKVLDTVAQTGETGTLKKIVQIGGDRARVQLRNADFDNLMAEAKKPGGELDGKKLLKAVEDRERDKTLSVLYGKEAPDLKLLAQKMAARQGAIDPKDIKPGSFKIALRRANDLQEKVPKAAKEAEAAQAKATPEAINDANKSLQEYAIELKQSSAAPEKVAAKARTIVGDLHSKGLLTDAQYEDYLKQAKQVDDTYKASGKSLADRKTARGRLLSIGLGIGALAGAWEGRKVLANLARGFGL